MSPELIDALLDRVVAMRVQVPTLPGEVRGRAGAILARIETELRRLRSVVACRRPAGAPESRRTAAEP